MASDKTCRNFLFLVNGRSIVKQWVASPVAYQSDHTATGGVTNLKEKSQTHSLKDPEGHGSKAFLLNTPTQPGLLFWKGQRDLTTPIIVWRLLFHNIQIRSPSPNVRHNYFIVSMLDIHNNFPVHLKRKEIWLLLYVISQTTDNSTMIPRQ